MISTVTTTTVTIVSDVALAGTIGFMAVLGLIAYLIVKHVVSADDHRTSRLLSEALNLAIVPLFLVFGVVVIDRICTVLGIG